RSRGVVRLDVLGAALSFCILVLQTPRPPLFPYTTLFRSSDPRVDYGPAVAGVTDLVNPVVGRLAPVSLAERGRNEVLCTPGRERSEEHTSELQSRENLVCRLLLEKKNVNIMPERITAWDA